MITKILVETLKRNKVQLKSAEIGDRFRIAIYFEFILGIFCGKVPLLELC